MNLKDLNDPSIDWADLSTMKTLTCRWHPGARYLTKNPYTRGIHFVEADPGMVQEWCLREGGEPPSDELVEALAKTPSPSMDVGVFQSSGASLLSRCKARLAVGWQDTKPANAYVAK